MNYRKNFPKNQLLAEVSLWSADFTQFGSEIKRIDPYADLYHIDVSDGSFVPGFLFFADLVSALRPLTEKQFHVHLMTTNPLAHIEDFVKAGADIITIHAENGPIAPAALQRIREYKIGAGLALGLNVDPTTIIPYIDLIDVILMMGTPMGVKGVDLSKLAYGRVQLMRRLVEEEGKGGQISIIADGGIRLHTVPLLRAAGADSIVMGSLAFKSQDLEETFRWIHSLPIDSIEYGEEQRC